MPHPQPHPPANLNPFAGEVLQKHAGRPAAADIVLGGGVALAHYLDYRDTFDLDAWWAAGPTPAARKLLAEVMQAVAKAQGLTLATRSWGETTSLELVDGQRSVFSLQIAARDRYLDAPLDAAWPPVRIETLRDNVASKMTAWWSGVRRATCATCMNSAGVAWSRSPSAGRCNTGSTPSFPPGRRRRRSCTLSND